MKADLRLDRARQGRSGGGQAAPGVASGGMSGRVETMTILSRLSGRAPLT